MSEPRICEACDGAGSVPIGDEMGDGGNRPCYECAGTGFEQVERTATGRVFTDADFERLATEAERDRYRDEVARLRCCIEAALERVELLDGGENDGYEAEAILRNALEGGKQ